MELRKVEEDTYVNVGTGNVTFVVAKNEDTVCIGFVGEPRLYISAKVEDIVEALMRQPTEFRSWGQTEPIRTD